MPEMPIRGTVISQTNRLLSKRRLSSFPKKWDDSW